MPSGRFVQYGAGKGMDDALQQMVAERIAAQMEAQKQAVEAYKLQQQDRQITQGDQRIGLDRDKFGQEQQQYTDAAPKREADLGYIRTQTADLAGKPMREADARAHQGLMAERGHLNTLSEIGARGSEELRVAQARPRDERTVQIMGPNGVPVWVRESDAIGKPAAQAPRAVTGAERQTLSYYNRAKQATDDIAPLEDQIANMGLAGQARLQVAPNFLQNDTNQQYRQAQRSFTEARLRKESGAAIPTAEYENDAKTYFAQPGDTKATLEQKRRARMVVLEGMKNSSGKAYDEFYGQSNAPAGGLKILSIEEVP